MLGALLKLGALEEFHSTLSEMFISYGSGGDISDIKRINDFCQKLKRTALAAERVANKEVVWMKVYNAITCQSGIESEARCIIHRLNLSMSHSFELPKEDIHDKEFSMGFFNRLNVLVNLL